MQLNQSEKFKSFVYDGCATNLWVMRNPPLEKGDKGGFLIENCLLFQKSPLTPLCQRGVIHSLPTNLSHTWFRAEGRVSNGPVEGLNLKAKLAMRKAYGFRNLKTLQIALYHALGNLPEPEISHKFC